MDYLAEHQKILELAAANQLPDRISDDGDVPVIIFRELYEQGLIDACDAKSAGGDCYLQSRITIPGREYLNQLQQRTFEASPAGKIRRLGARAVDWALGIVAGLLIARFSQFPW